MQREWQVERGGSAARRGPVARCAALWFAVCCVLTVLGSRAPAALAQAWPERPIIVIVPFAPGGSSDTSARILGEVMAKDLGQALVIENVSGAGGTTGSLRARNARPDGYTVGIGHMGTHAAAVSTTPKLPYDPRTDFDYIGIQLLTPSIVVARKDFPAATLAEFVAEARRLGKGLKVAHNGIGSFSHLSCLYFYQLIGVEPSWVVYRGFGQTINDLLSGAIDGTCDLVSSVRGHVLGGSVKGYGVSTTARLPSLPDFPTATEAGVPGYVIDNWIGMYAPKGLPRQVLARLRTVHAKALDDPAVVQEFLDMGGTLPAAADRGGERMHEIVKADVARWSDIIAKSGAVPEEGKK